MPGGGSAEKGYPVLKIVMALISNTNGGLPEGLATLQNASLGDQISSSLGQRKNVPVASADVEHTMRQETLLKLAGQFWMQRGKAAATLANAHPGIIDKSSPNGEPSNDNHHAQEGLSMLGALLCR